MLQRIGIVGAGPAGLIAAIAAAKLGFDVEIFERATRFERLGGGIGIQANGMQVLDSLDLLDTFRPSLYVMRSASIFSPPSRLVSRADFPEVAIPHAGFAVVERYLLQEHLVSALRDNGVQIQFGKQCTGVDANTAGATLHFTDDTDAQFDVVIACDGIHSAVRDSAGMRARKRHIGEAYLRAVAPHRIELDAVGEYWGTDGSRMGMFPVAGGRTYVFCSVPLGHWQMILAHRLDEWLKSWYTYGAEVVSLMRSVDWSTAVYDELQEVHLESWFKTRVFIAGDAAHAMTPNLGQGANSGMVDSLVLVRLLDEARESGEPAALDEVGRKYEHIRKAFVTRIQNAARQGGSAASWTSPAARALRDGAIRVGGQVALFRRASLRLIAGYNPREQHYISRPINRS